MLRSNPIGMRLNYTAAMTEQRSPGNLGRDQGPAMKLDNGRLIVSPALRDRCAALVFSDVPGSAIALLEVADRMADLYPEETTLVVSSVSKRQREFSSGRHAARLALAALHPQVQQDHQKLGPIPRDDERRPIWPEMHLGTISHSDQLAGALVTASAEVRGVGLDIETAGRVSDDLLERLLTARERASLSGDPARLFSAKEAVYKAVNPLFGRYIAFTDVEVVERGADRFAMRYVGSSAQERVMESGIGYWRRLGSEWISVFWLPTNV